MEHKRTRLPWETRKNIYAAIGVLLVLALGFFLADRALQAAAQWLFGPASVKSFDAPSVAQVLHKAEVTIPENAQFLYGEYWGWQDASVDLVFSIPYAQSEAQLPDYLKKTFGVEAWENAEVYLPKSYNTFCATCMPNIAGTFSLRKDGHILEIDYSPRRMAAYMCSCIARWIDCRARCPQRAAGKVLRIAARWGQRALQKVTSKFQFVEQTAYTVRWGHDSALQQVRICLTK